MKLFFFILFTFCIAISQTTNLSSNTSEKFNISGFVISAKTGESIVGANVFLDSSDYGTTTDLDGYFILFNIPKDNYNLIISYLGYEEIKRPIYINDNVDLKIELYLKPLSIDEIKVLGDEIDRKKNFQISRVKLNTLQLRNIPQIAEADLFRSLQSLPGVLTQNDFSTGLVIRGGNTDQNLILLDGITVYNPSHVGGVFSNFILDAIKEVDLQKGGYNAEYGGRLSSVLKVTSREGNSKELSGSTSISALSAQFLAEAPIKNGAWILAGRRTYFDQLFKGTDFFFPYYFYDLQGHIYQDISSKKRISVSFYKGEDNLKWDDEFGIEAIWANNTVSINYRVFHSQQLLSNWMIAKSKFNIFTGLGRNSSEGIVEKDYIDDFTFRNDWTLYLSNDKHFNFGIETKNLNFNYDSSDNGEQVFYLEQSPIESALYSKYKISTPNFLLQPGIRINHFSNLTKKWYVDPRLQIKYFINDSRYLNFSIGQYHQFMSTLQDDFNPSVIDAWFATDNSVKPGSSQQITFGIEDYRKNDIYIQCEVYYKKLNNMLTFVNKAATVNPGTQFQSYNVLDSLVDMSNGYSYGLEIFAQKKTGRLNGWINYTYSIARKIFNQKEYYTNWDRSHVFNFLGNYRLSKKWDFNIKFTYQKGQPYTPILGYYIENFPPSEQTQEVIPGGRNSVRFPDYHRLDFGAIRHYNYRGYKIDLFVQVINLYNRKNPFTHDYIFGDSENGVDDDGDGIIDEDDEDIPIKNEINGFPLLPTIGVKIDF